MYDPALLPVWSFLAWSHVPASLVDTHSGPPSARTRLVPAHEPSGGCRPWDRITTNLLLGEIEPSELDAVVRRAVLALTLCLLPICLSLSYPDTDPPLLSPRLSPSLSLSSLPRLFPSPAAAVVTGPAPHCLSAFRSFPFFPS